MALLSTLLAAGAGFLPGMGRDLLLASGPVLLGGPLAAPPYGEGARYDGPVVSRRTSWPGRGSAGIDPRRPAW